MKTIVPTMEDETTSNHTLYTFLASQNVFSQKAKDKLNEVSGYDDIMVDLVNTCATLFENGQFVQPGDKHMLLKVSFLTNYAHY